MDWGGRTAANLPRVRRGTWARGLGHLFLKHFIQHLQHAITVGCLQFAKPFDDALFINRSNLVENDVSLHALKCAFHP